MKKTINLFILFILMWATFGVRDVQASTDIRYIYSVDDFNQISNQLNGHYRLMNDLDFKGTEQLPIGTKDKPFTGVFDGNGFSVSNYQLQRTDSMTHIGLFGHAKNATFRNLFITETQLTIGIDNNLELFGGALLGHGESVMMENIQIDSSVSVTIEPLFKSTVGGIAGEIKGTSLKPSFVLNVSNEGTISGKYRIGGILGSASYTTIESAKNYGVIKGGDSAGGIVGYLSQSKLFQVENDGDIKSTQSSGGIVGNASYSIVEKGLNKGFVQSSGSWSDVGGIIGFMRKTNLTDAKNTGSFFGKGSQTDIGGLVGDAGQESIIRNGMNQSDIVTSDSSIGGIVGEVSQSLIQQTYNEGDLSGSTGGGISSAISNSVIQNSFNIGKIQGSVTSGGLVGYAYQDSRIESSYNSGFVRRSYLHGALAGKYEGTMQGVYGVTQSRLIGEGAAQGQTISPTATVVSELMPHFSSAVWEFSSEHYPLLKDLERPTGKQQYPIVVKQINLKKATYRQYEEIDLTDGQALVVSNTGKEISVPLNESMLWQNHILENTGEQSVLFQISGLSSTTQVQVTPRYRAMFMNHQNVQIDVQYVEPGQKAQPTVIPDREGYTLQQWTPEFEPMSKDQIYKPIYTKNTYNIQLKDGDQLIDTVPFFYGERLSSKIQEPTKSNHFFIGWYKDQALTEKIDLFQNVTESIDLYARFIPAPEVTNLKVVSKGGDATLSWNGTVGTTFYFVDVSNDPDFASFIRYKVNERNYHLYLAPKDTHYIRVKPILTLENQDWEGSSSTVFRDSLIKKIEGIKISDVTSTSVNLSWNRQNYDHFYVYRAVDNGMFKQVATVKTAAWADTRLDHRKDYQYKIVGHLKLDETGGLLSEDSDVVSVRLKFPYTGSWEINPIGENSTVVTGKALEPNGHVEVYKGSQRLGQMTKIINGSYKVVIPKQPAGTLLTVKLYPHSMYDVSMKKVYVKKMLPAFTVSAPAAMDKVLTGKGKPGATVRAYVGSNPISKSIKIGSNGTFKLTITSQTGGREVQVKMSQSGYLDRIVKTKVLYVFKTFKIGTVKSSHTYMAGNGNRGAKVQAYVGTKAISKPSTVNTKGAYRLTIPKQKQGTVIKVKMTQNGYKTQDKTIKVIK